MKIKSLAPNHVEISVNGDTFLGSFDSIVAVRHGDDTVELDEKYWNYSSTTGRHRNAFLCESKSDTDKKIKSGVYKLSNLNQL